MGTLRLITPTHYAFGPQGASNNDSPCGLLGLWLRGVKYTRERGQVSCRRCRKWIKNNPEPKDVTPHA